MIAVVSVDGSRRPTCIELAKCHYVSIVKYLVWQVTTSSWGLFIGSSGHSPWRVTSTSGTSQVGMDGCQQFRDYKLKFFFCLCKATHILGMDKAVVLGLNMYD